ncbi:MAG: hypothetical protein ABUL77_04785 [Bacteroidota bacterium]
MARQFHRLMIVPRVDRATPIVTLAVALAGAFVLGCGPSASSSAQPRTAVSSESDPDAGHPLPKPSSRKGIIVPSDTGIGVAPPGIGNSTGTSGGKTAGPGMGN